MCNQCKIFTEKGLYYCSESYDPFIYCPFCGEKLKHSVKEDKGPEVYETLFDYLRSMDAATWDSPDYDKWRYTWSYHDKYPDKPLKEIIAHVEKKFKK